MSRLEGAANVLLRVPCVVALDLLYRWDVQDVTLLTPDPSILKARSLQDIYYLAQVTCAVLLLLPLRHLLHLYLYLLTALLLYMGHQTARDYIRKEMEAGVSGSVYEDAPSLTRSVSTLTGLVMVATLCSMLMRTRQVWFFSAPVLPLLARLGGLPLQALPLLSTLSIAPSLLVMTYTALTSLGGLRSLFRAAYEEMCQVTGVSRLLAVGVTLWSQLAVPLLFLVFWLVVFILHIVSTLSSKPGSLEQQGPLFIFLNSVAECCGTPYCLLGLTFTVSYLALGTLNLCKFYLLGYSALQNGNVMHRGVTEGVTLMLLALQTGLLDLHVLQRTFLLSIILFIVVTSTLQSMVEISDPIVLALAATGNRSLWKHLRGLSMCLFLFIFPSFMAYKLSHFFDLDFWLLIMVSSCLLTSLQVLGTLFIYALFMVELLQNRGVERMDEIIYGVSAVSRVLEFLVAVCVVGYGIWESMFGEWSWIGVSVIIVHSYINVWLRAQSGWSSFLLRRAAANKISSLPRATAEQLRAHNDLCSICFQEMSGAVITSCCHYFHPDCLRKWLYIQDTCPLCHKPVTSSSAPEEWDWTRTGAEEGVGSEEEMSQEEGQQEGATEDAGSPEEEIVEGQPGGATEDAGSLEEEIVEGQLGGATEDAGSLEEEILEGQLGGATEDAGSLEEEIVEEQ
ncbi:RING finger protein 145-like isoform X2 [Dendropsophus ebraccatus]|uniref:RING finger protein 145-like isoform X2 n=1 Tax=Dendropsophus ebraccatus TaxID=150705 RepID=UPI0038311FD4